LQAVSKYVRHSDVVWDIGSNVGVFSVAAAHIAGRLGQVLAVEADPFLASLLHRTLCEHTNSDLPINVLCAAASDCVGIGRFLVAKRGRMANSLESAGHRSTAGGTRYVQYVPLVTLDSLLADFGSPAVVKIDVEGAEAAVLRGAIRVLSECRPLIYVEVCGTPSEEVFTILQRHDYRLYDGDADDEKELSHWAFNTLAVPRESNHTNRRREPVTS